MILVRREAVAWFVLIAFCSSWGCTFARRIPADDARVRDEYETRCALSTTSPRHPTPKDSSAQLDLRRAPLPSYLSPHTRRLAGTIGLADLLKLIAQLEEQQRTNPGASRERLIQARQQLSNHVLLVLFDVASAAAEVRCQRERADHFADRLQEARNKEVRLLTIAAIISGALFGFLSGGLFLAGASTAGTAAGITGGVVQTAFGSIALAQHGVHPFHHGRNVLRDIWEAPAEASAIPRSVWRFLNQPIGDDPLHRSLRETLIVRWRDDGRLGAPGSTTERRRIGLFFSDGGLYEIDDLRARAAMLDLLESDIQLMSQDLDLLIQEALIEPSEAEFTEPGRPVP
jgi:hypothetical protein